jgi:hypothetical protein
MTASTQKFPRDSAGLPAATRMKLVGGDSSRVEHEQFVEDVILAPSERIVLDACFDTPGRLVLEHRTPDRSYTLADITVTDEQATPPLAETFSEPRTAPELVAEHERLLPLVGAAPDKTLAFQVEMDSDHPMHHPFHIHGAGRFLVLARDDVVEPNLVSKDTVLVRTGEVVDIVLDVTA